MSAFDSQKTCHMGCLSLVNKKRDKKTTEYQKLIATKILFDISKGKYVHC